MNDLGVKGFWVGDWLVQPELNQISRDGDEKHIELKSMSVLECLVAKRGEVLSQDQLMEAVWTDTHVNPESLSHAIWDLRRAFGDDARNPTYIKTIHGRGYRLIAEIKGLTPESLHRRKDDPPPTIPSPLPWKRLILLLGLVVIVAAAATWMAWPPPLPPPAGPRLLLTAEAESGAKQRRLLEAARLEVANVDSFALIPENRPGNRPFDKRDFRLDLSLPASGDMAVVSFALYSLESGGHVYTGNASLGPASKGSESLEKRLVLFGELNATELFHDPHIKPWFDLRRHDWASIQSFLRAALRSLNWEFGHPQEYVEAAADQAFLSPLIWGHRSFVDTTPESRAAFIARLERIRSGTDDFESAVARFMISFLQRNSGEALRDIRDALAIEPGNGPLLVNRAAIESITEGAGPEAALETLEILITRRWRYPSVYPQAADYALRLGRFDRARKILAIGLDMEPDVIDTLALLEALAWLDGDFELADGYRKRLLARLAELLPGERTIDVEDGYGAIIKAARARGLDPAVTSMESRLEELVGKTD